MSSQTKLMNAIRKFTVNEPDVVLVAPYGMTFLPVVAEIVTVMLVIAALEKEQPQSLNWVC